MKGKNHTSKTKEKMKLAKLGRLGIGGMTGKNHSFETCRKMSSSFQGKHFSLKTEFKKGNLAPTTAFILNDPRVSGGNNYNWKGGITPEIRKIRLSTKTLQWRKDVFKRDGFTCQKCKDNKGGNLAAHHIRNFSSFPLDRFLVNNGITFCINCHDSFHRIYGCVLNNKQQMEEFQNEFRCSS